VGVYDINPRRESAPTRSSLGRKRTVFKTYARKPGRRKVAIFEREKQRQRVGDLGGKVFPVASDWNSIKKTAFEKSVSRETREHRRVQYRAATVKSDE